MKAMSTPRMAGTQASTSGISASLTGLALNLRDQCQAISNLFLFMDNLGTAIGDSGPRPTTQCEDIAKWNVPVLLIHGVRSPGRYPAMGQAAQRCNPRLSGPVTIPDAAHSMNRENPSAFNRAVLGFLSKL